MVADCVCTFFQMREAVNNSFFLDSHNFGIDKNEPTDTAAVSAAACLYVQYTIELRVLHAQ